MYDLSIESCQCITGGQGSFRKMIEPDPAIHFVYDSSILLKEYLGSDAIRLLSFSGLGVGIGASLAFLIGQSLFRIPYDSNLQFFLLTEFSILGGMGGLITGYALSI
ncbi:MAG: hypothetical protein U1E78_01790 [Gammaproteobacteria bacterium]